MILPPSKPFALNMFWNVDFSVAMVKIKSSWTKGPLPSNGGGTAAPITGQMVSSYYLAVRINAGCMSNFVSSCITSGTPGSPDTNLLLLWRPAQVIILVTDFAGTMAFHSAPAVPISLQQKLGYLQYCAQDKWNEMDYQFMNRQRIMLMQTSL